MPTPIPTDLATILPVLRARLVDWVELPLERVGLLQRDDVPFHSQADSYLFLRVEGGTFIMGDVEGAGRINTKERILFSITCRTRLALDEANVDYLWMVATEESRGNAILRHKVLDAMMLFQPEDEDGNWLITEPIKPDRTLRPRKASGNNPNKEWGESTLWFVLTYHLDLDQDYQ